MGVFEDLGVQRVINAAGTLTRLGGRLMAPEVVAAMADAARSHVRIDQLQERAGAYLAEAAGAEAGYVTSGAAAGVTLGVAACIAGLDVAKMERMPPTAADGPPPEVVVQRGHRNAYDHAVRAAGARLVETGWAGHPGTGRNAAWLLEAAITERTVAFYHLVSTATQALPLADVCEVAHRHGLPVVVDAAASLPPRGNLTRFVAEGADLVAFSGGKAIGGPQASGILVGRADLIESVALQQQDMDVHPATWSQRERYLATGRLPGPPQQGFGRGFKVGKEEIAGLVVALRRYLAADPAAEEASWRARCERLAAALADLPGLEVAVVAPAQRPLPQVELRPRPGAPLDAVGLVRGAAAGTPPLHLSEAGLDAGVVAIVPTCLDPADDERVVEALRALWRGGRGGGGHRGSGNDT